MSPINISEALPKRSIKQTLESISLASVYLNAIFHKQKEISLIQQISKSTPS